MPLLEDLVREDLNLLSNLLELWQVISESGIIGQETELTLDAKAKFDRACEMRPNLLALIQERLLESDISLASL